MELLFNFLLLGVVASFTGVFYRAFRLAQSKGNVEGEWNALGLMGVIVAFLLCYISSSVLLGYPLIPYPFDVLMLGWAGLILAIQMLYRKVHKTSRAPAIAYVAKEQFSLGLEVKRKLTHMAVLLLLSTYFGVGAAVYVFIDTLIQSAFALNVSIWGIPGLTFSASHASWLAAVFGTLGAFFLLAIPDAFRLFDPGSYMLAPATALMRANEQTSPSGPVVLILAALVPLVAIPNLLLALAAITIAVVGDGFASICGRRFGRHKLKSNPAKSYEGLVAGVISGFTAGAVLLLFQFEVWQACLLALLGSAILGAVDLPKVPLSDNILNPVVISLGMYATSLLL